MCIRCIDTFLIWLARSNMRGFCFWNTSWEIKSCSFPTDKAEIWNVLNGFKTYTNPTLMCVKITWQKSRGCSDRFLIWLARSNRRVYSFWNTSWEIKKLFLPNRWGRNMKRPKWLQDLHKAITNFYQNYLTEEQRVQWWFPQLACKRQQEGLQFLKHKLGN